jgi:hypothetical protein
VSHGSCSDCSAQTAPQVGAGRATVVPSCSSSRLCCESSRLPVLRSPCGADAGSAHRLPCCFCCALSLLCCRKSPFVTRPPRRYTRAGAPGTCQVIEAQRATTMSGYLEPYATSVRGVYLELQVHVRVLARHQLLQPQAVLPRLVHLCMRPSATSACSLKLLVYAALSYSCMRP